MKHPGKTSLTHKDMTKQITLHNCVEFSGVPICGEKQV